MDLLRIKSLVEVMAASDLSEMCFEQEGWALTLKRGGPVAPTEAPTPVAVPLPSALAAPSAAEPQATTTNAPRVQCSPLFGTLHWQASPEDPPFVSAGQAVQAGQTLLVIEAMKVFNTVVAEHDGVVDALLAASGDEVDVGQPLIRFR